MIVLEFKLKGKPQQYWVIDDMIRTAQFIRNKALRYWMDNQSVKLSDLYKQCAVLAKEFEWAGKLNSMARQASAERAIFAIQRFFANCKANKPGEKGYPQFKNGTRSVEYKTSGWKISSDKRSLTFTDGFAAGTFKLVGSRDLHFYAPDEIKRVRVIRHGYGSVVSVADSGNMSYSDFKTIDQAVSTLELTVEDIPHFFSQVVPIEPSQRLKETLDETLDLAASISTEKARSELIITPILLEVRRIFHNKIGYFSGNTFNVDEGKGLTGVCDFILSASINQSLVTAPVLTLVEAKNNDIRIGLGQCVAQMVAAQIFNARKGLKQPVVYGAVSTGTNWKFIRLENQVVKIDMTEYFITQLNQILGILAEPFRIYFEGAIA